MEGKPNVHRYYMVINQYTRKINSDKFIKFVKNESTTLTKSMINMRLAPADVSARLTGYTHNAVTPFGLATALPMIISHHLLALTASPVYDYVWLGAGEKDLKVKVTQSHRRGAYTRLHTCVLTSVGYGIDERY